MTLIRHGQPGITGIFPHNGNNKFLITTKAPQLVMAAMTMIPAAAPINTARTISRPGENT